MRVKNNFIMLDVLGRILKNLTSKSEVIVFRKDLVFYKLYSGNEMSAQKV